MRALGASRISVAPGGTLIAGWVKNELWRRARAVPSLDLRFADNKSLVDATTGQNLISFTRASSGTYVDSQGVIRTATTNEARFDHAITSSTTNLQTWSEDFRNTADAGTTRPWSYNTSSVTTDNTTAPNGTTTADLIAGVAGTANKFLSSNIPTTAQGVYTFSVYLKQGTEQFVVVRLSDGSANGIRGRFDLAAGTVVVTNEGTATGQAASATAVGNGWYRCVVTCSVSSLPNSVMQPQLWLNNFASTSLTTNYFAWGAQLEQSSTVGAYVPTTTAAATSSTTESLGLLVEESRTNFATQSESFSGWTVAGLTQTTAAALNPSGSTGVQLFTEDTANSTHRLFVSPTTGQAINSFSVWVKPASGSRLFYIEADNASGIRRTIRFNLQAGVLDSNTGDWSNVFITSFPNGWFRVGGTITDNGGTVLVICGNSSGTSAFYTGDGTSGFYLWGAQLEAGAFPTSYIPTTAAAATRSADVASISGSNFSSWYRQDEGTVFAEVANVRGTGPTVTVRATTTASDRMQFVNANGQTAVIVGGVAQVLFGGNTARQSFAYRANDFAQQRLGISLETDVNGSVPTVDYATIGRFDFGGADVINGTIRRLTYWPQRLSNPTLSSITQ